MKRIIAFGASNSKNSINKAFAEYAVGQLTSFSVEVLDLNDFEMPIYSIDREKENGIHQKALDFKRHIAEADGIVISFAEHNGSYTAAYKNIYDWVSRIEKNVWLDKPMLLLATSPGSRGAKSVLETASKSYRRANSNKVLEFSLPSFNTNFNKQEGITDHDLLKDFADKISLFQKAVIG